jgi:ParB family chromosome partitioning protein
MSAKKHLGRGLSALLGGDDGAGGPSAQRSVPVEFLHPGKYQPRGSFNPDELAALAQSVKENGILQPILVRAHPVRVGEFEIVAGERRWRAAQMAQLHEVPIIEREFGDREVLEVALIENVQRQDLTPLEEAEGYRRLMAEFDYTQEVLALRIGKSRSNVANLLRLLDLPGQVRSLIAEGKLSVGHARALLNCSDPVALAQEVVAKGLNVRQTELLAQSFKAKKPKKARDAKPKTAKPKDADTRALEADLTLKLGLKVEIDFDGKSGQVVINYKSLDQLDELIAKLSK